MDSVADQNAESVVTELEEKKKTRTLVTKVRENNSKHVRGKLSRNVLMAVAKGGEVLAREYVEGVVFSRGRP